MYWITVVIVTLKNYRENSVFWYILPHVSVSARKISINGNFVTNSNFVTLRNFITPYIFTTHYFYTKVQLQNNRAQLIVGIIFYALLNFHKVMLHAITYRTCHRVTKLPTFIQQIKYIPEIFLVLKSMQNAIILVLSKSNVCLDLLLQCFCQMGNGG
jgi:hypothetical protein